MERALKDAVYDDFDRLIQLCDSLALAAGIVTLETRLIDVGLRHGFNDYTQRKWKAFMDIKKDFDVRCGKNIYHLFHDEISQRIFGDTSN